MSYLLKKIIENLIYFLTKILNSLNLFQIEQIKISNKKEIMTNKKKPSDTLEEFEAETTDAEPETQAKPEVVINYSHVAFSIAKIKKENGSEVWAVLRIPVDPVNMKTKSPEIAYEDTYRELVTEKFRILVSQNVL